MHENKLRLTVLMENWSENWIGSGTRLQSLRSSPNPSNNATLSRCQKTKKRPQKKPDC